MNRYLTMNFALAPPSRLSGVMSKYKLKMPVNMLFYVNNGSLNGKHCSKAVSKIKVTASKYEHFQHFDMSSNCKL
jgi:hypothetical protein